VAERTVVWTETAAKQRREILRYWTERNKSPVYDEELIKLIGVRISAILKHPESFPQTIYPETRVQQWPF
jgi:plasmid stabilization system protein ParE